MVMNKLKKPVFATMLPRVALTAFNFCQPFLVERAVLLSQEPITPLSRNIGYGMIGAYFIVYVGIAISMGQYQVNAIQSSSDPRLRSTYSIYPIVPSPWFVAV
jgi:ATP-binding cassette, subfamily C (CFTR/MRP), member 1